ncbi:unnamed protein product [Phytophthora lilii]|uniref:Unnamed protein product n=1 Tax=Phytophthora lilii TaxID=2077276 RepID=A0A9W6WM70_9STRA|nr:unnamed protein product [Phytophthora lilii]
MVGLTYTLASFNPILLMRTSRYVAPGDRITAACVAASASSAAALSSISRSSTISFSLPTDPRVFDLMARVRSSGNTSGSSDSAPRSAARNPGQAMEGETKNNLVFPTVQDILHILLSGLPLAVYRAQAFCTHLQSHNDFLDNVLVFIHAI